MDKCTEEVAGSSPVAPAMLYNLAVLIITVSSFAGLVIIATSYDPYTAGKLIKFLFFGSLVLVLSGLVMGIRIILKNRWRKNSSK
ncbi:MAG: hypothetical protein A2655_02345 [Candidatus Yanofskybacteria bacterium RIFCSPHIGHO2_01_FULL_43_42]|uniref:Uncharacterized protein n=1 Tax=Candidatus Yanofskybacteria bacterium RIFCSPLOWO2_01_FULL_43_22 TaxID=1802695 RepID=A0A1F8GGH0_9BACT|nr:MAG: hypothetical protein A2655_02345 [Candidatus Yanofskybacteria bacterium RIFCSPHIGHO2_01_FULL_43_42]OGN13356.1 MAG: hypothetical protein A3D48_00705 [Candidatus Yanofskybacteria bacterium RIFCSPHIGHO2_02_FULL_43_17]OGN24401.1 MAG: hypothetical protein A3A13_01660 [Candidatus Yanofskybacteria bacterium RIFCSPLOWO2_01_FULL_43_22]